MEELYERLEDVELDVGYLLGSLQDTQDELLLTRRALELLIQGHPHGAATMLNIPRGEGS